MHHERGKPINTSVPSIAIRFNANAEAIEELYQSEEESIDKSASEKSKSTGASDPESSPLRSYLRLGKRSTSIDNSLSQDSSPPSDPWKFLADIKGKITKSVEDTFTEIKHRNQEGKTPAKEIKDTKDNSSLSDSEDLSESSLSKTCGIVSTTEGVEMSTDDETSSLEKDKKLEEAVKKSEESLTEKKSKESLTEKKSEKSSSSDLCLRRRYRLSKSMGADRETTISTKSLVHLYELNTGLKLSVPNGSKCEDASEVESGVEAFEDEGFDPTKEFEVEMDSVSGTSDVKSAVRTQSGEDLLTSLAEQIENFEVDDDNCIKIRKIDGVEIQQAVVSDEKPHTFFAPEGFVDLRKTESEFSWYAMFHKYRQVLGLSFLLVFYLIFSIPVYVSGFVAGVLFTLSLVTMYNKLFGSALSSTPDLTFSMPVYNSQAILEIPAVREYQPVVKFEGLMNEYPDNYDPQTYHISQTQSVYVRLQGNLLRVSNVRGKIPKRALWNEQKHKLIFLHHRIYNLLEAKIILLPEGLNKKRHWSKKYPICIVLNKDQTELSFTESNIENEDDKKSNKSTVSDTSSSSSKKSFFSRKKKVPVSPQIFSKLTEEDEEFEIESGSSRPSSPSPRDDHSPDFSEEKQIEEEDLEMNELLREDLDDEVVDDSVSLGDWTTFVQDENASQTRIYLFGRTDREKEDWFRRFATATHRGAYNLEDSSHNVDVKEAISNTLLNAEKNENEYLKYMAQLHKVILSTNSKRILLPMKSMKTKVKCDPNVLWVNALLGRILFDCTRDDNATKSLVKERIQRKLSSIKLPYFIEQLIVTELSLGSSPPTIHKASKPVLDQRGLWIDLDITYDGTIVLNLQTKLNLMKLKQPGGTSETVLEDANSSAKWLHSDVDDTAESSTDDEVQIYTAKKVLDDVGNPVVGLGGTSNASKKIIKMVDKIAESKFFQAATENRYIKKAMEGVSNTELGLKVEIKGLIGTLVLNIPPPPSDRIWYGFRPTPKLYLSAQPIVGERSFGFLRQLTSWIEKKLLTEFQKVLVIPNMEDILIPVMSPKLPE